MIDFITGNLCSLLAMVTDSISSTRKSTKSMLLFQTISQLFYVAGSIVLKGYSAAVQNAVSIVRNLVAIRKTEQKFIEWTLIVLGVVLGLYFNNLGFIGLLPVIANLEYSISVFKFKNNEKALKIAFLIMVAMFTVFNASILNIVGAVSNVVVFVTTLVVLLKNKTTEQKN